MPPTGCPGPLAKQAPFRGGEGAGEGVHGARQAVEFLTLLALQGGEAPLQGGELLRQAPHLGVHGRLRKRVHGLEELAFR